MKHEPQLLLGCTLLMAAACSSRLELGGGERPVDLGTTGSAAGGGPQTGGPAGSNALGQHCSVNADCVSPLVCAEGRCHATCSPSVGCQEGHRLLPCLTESAAVPVCPLPCDPAWGMDSKFCVRAGEPDDGPPGLYQCPSFPSFAPDDCATGQTMCSLTCANAASSVRQDCDQGVCNCTYNGMLACRCVTSDPASVCSFCCN
jgi:hypothetical protein